MAGKALPVTVLLRPQAVSDFGIPINFEQGAAVPLQPFTADINFLTSQKEWRLKNYAHFEQLVEVVTKDGRKALVCLCNACHQASLSDLMTAHAGGKNPYPPITWPKGRDDEKTRMAALFVRQGTASSTFRPDSGKQIGVLDSRKYIGTTPNTSFKTLVWVPWRQSPNFYKRAERKYSDLTSDSPAIVVSQALAVGIGLFLLFVNSIAGGITLMLVEQFQWFKYIFMAPLYYISMNANGLGMDVKGLSPGLALGVLAVYYVVFMALSFIFFQKRDVSV